MIEQQVQALRPEAGAGAEVIDIAIIGGGPAGLAAGLYAARARRRTVLWEAGLIGGQIATTSVVENYPGFPEGIGGFELSQRMQAQAERFGMETRYERVASLDRRGSMWALTMDGGETVLAKAVIVTAGAEPNRLGIPGERELTGHGVSYCATCDGAFFKDEVVAVVGGGDAAIDEALFLTRFASRVYVIHRRATLRASAVLQERAAAEPKIEFVWDTVVERIDGDGGVESLALRHLPTGQKRALPVAGVFIFIGQRPSTGFLEGLLELDEGGHACVDPWMQTAQPGLFVAGDVRAQSARQVVSAAGDGATAAIRADRYIGGTLE